MKKLLWKELVLSMHPTGPIMLLLSAMVLIPNYPYTVIFFYTTLSIFFTCLGGRENNDVVYSLTLPIAKKDVVKGRFLFACFLQLLQILLLLPFSAISQRLNSAGNEAGMEANLALLGFGFLLYAVFNTIFFRGYYKNVKKVGVSFLWSSGILFLCVGFLEASTYLIPFVRDYLDTKDPQFLGYKLLTLALCILVYMVATYFTYRKSVKAFEKQDL